MVGSMADLPAFAGVLKKAPPDVTQACVTLQKSFRGYADRSAAVVLADLGRCGDADFKLIRKTIERRRPFDLSGPDVDEARAGVPRAPQASRRVGPSKKSPSRKVVSRSQVRGGYRDMKGGVSLESGGHNEAKGIG